MEEGRANSRLIQSIINGEAWIKYMGLPVGDLLDAEDDRTFWAASGATFAHLMAYYVEKKLVEANYRNHGDTAWIGWREARSRWAAQCILHKDASRVAGGYVLEIDFDGWNPWDIVGLVGHGWEVLGNKVRGSKTDAFKVARQLRRRGVLL